MHKRLLTVLLGLVAGCAPPAADDGSTASRLADGQSLPAACTKRIEDLTTPSAPLAAALATVTADNHVTSDEWTQVLDPIVEGLPTAASADSRALVALWASTTITLDESARESLQAALALRFGYSIYWDSVATTYPLATWLERNVTENDFDFECMQTVVGPSAYANVAVLDTGFDFTNPALAQKAWTNRGELPDNGIDDENDGFIDDVNGWDFVLGVPALDPGGIDDAADHGSHVSGLATSGTRDLQVMGLRVTEEMFAESEIPAQNAGTAAAIDYAVAHGATFINRSGPVPGDVTPVADAMKRYPNVLFTIASGDDGGEVKPGQAQYGIASLQLPNVVIVGASDESGSPASYSSHSATLVDVAAAGMATSTLGMRHRQYGAGEGTSMSAPVVMNIAAKCALLAPSLTPVELKKLLYLATTKSAAWANNVAAGGVVSARAALRIAALTALVRNGRTIDDAADVLALAGDERTALIASQRQLAP